MRRAGLDPLVLDQADAAAASWRLTDQLRAVRPLAHDLGIDPALVTCDTCNAASRKVIQANGGVLEDGRHGKLRFSVPIHQA